jgi:hypothetical protein
MAASPTFLYAFFFQFTTQKPSGESLKQRISAVATSAGGLKKEVEADWER